MIRLEAHRTLAKPLESWCRLLAAAECSSSPPVLAADDWGCGWDLGELRADAANGFPVLRRLQLLCDRIADRGDAIVEVRGRCIGPGFAIALHARTIAVPSGARPSWVGTREVAAGLLPLLDTTHRVSRRLPPSTAVGVLAGELLDARWLSVSGSPFDSPTRAAETTDARLVLPPMLPGRHDALGRLIDAVDAPRQHRHDVELDVLAALLDRADAPLVERRYGAFASPDLHRPPAPVGPVTVLGTGRMGTTIAAASAAAGIPTVIVGRTSERARQAVDGAGSALDRLARKGPLRGDPVAARACLRPEVTIPRETEGVVEAVIEDAAIKREVLAWARAMAPEAWLTSTTSTIPIADLGGDVGLTHFAFPAEIVPTVEVAFARGFPHRDRVLSWLRALDKRPVEVAAAPGYAATRLLLAYVFSALHLYDHHALDAATIDAAARAGGFSLGPFLMFDAGGLDLAEHVARTVLEPAHGSRFAPPASLSRLVEAGRIGRRVGHGFYRWVDGRPVSERPGSGPPGEVDPAAVAACLRAAVVDEATRCLEEGIATEEDIDVLAVTFARCFPIELVGPFAVTAGTGARR